jgi:DNA mismatch repair protein MutH
MNERKAGWARTPMIPAVRRDLFGGGGASWEASGLDRGLWIVYSGRATLPDYERESDSALVWSPGKNGEAVAFFHFS